MNTFKAHDYPEIYKALDIDLSALGCLMLDTEPIPYDFSDWHEDLFYKSNNKKRFWIDGFVGAKTPHVTLLYGFLKPAIEYKTYINNLLEDVYIKDVEIENISYFDSPYEDEEYYCIVAKLKITDDLAYANEKLQLLPHVRTFPDYKAHVTIAYVRKDENARDKYIKHLKPLIGSKLKVTGLNFGGDK